MNNLLKIICVGLAVNSVVADGKTIKANSSNIVQAFKTAVGGDHIVLSGNFGFLRLQGSAYSSLVTVDASSAHFKDTLVFYDARNIAFTGGVFGNPTGKTRWGRSVQVYNSSNIGFDRAQITGDGTGGGVNFTNVKGAYIVNSSFSHLVTSGNFYKVDGGTISNNIVVRQTDDGFTLVSSHNIKASHNSCFGATPALGHHPDCIQIWSAAGSAPTSNIEISDNLSFGDSQGFTKFRSGGFGGSNISILRNVVESTYAQGIACYECTDSVVKDNFLVTLKSAPHFVNLHVIGGSDNLVEGNVFLRSDGNSFVTPLINGPNSSAGVLVGGAHAAIPNQMTTILAPAALSAQIGAVPEPSMWATLFAGFALQGGAMRMRRARRTVRAPN